MYAIEFLVFIGLLKRLERCTAIFIFPTQINTISFPVTVRMISSFCFIARLHKLTVLVSSGTLVTSD